MAAKKTVKKGGKKKAAKAGGKAKAKAKAKGAKPKAAKKANKKPENEPKKKAAKAPARKAATAKPAGKVLATSVNLGHIFALRPRVETSFRPIHMQQAKHQLVSEAFDSIEDAARAVADKALESTHEGSNSGAFKSKRR
jgi:hypothetical protein